MFVRLLAVTILTVVVAVPASAQTLPCANPAADPCLINSTVNIPVGVYDIRPRSLSVANKQITVTGAVVGNSELKILAANVTFQPGARFVAGGTDGNTTITLDATGTMDLQSQGTSKSKIDVSGNFGGGTINLHSVGSLSVNGTLISNATNVLGFGGGINVKSDTGNVTITGDPSEGLRSLGNAQGGGGSISIEATAGSINVSTQLVPKGGDCGSCEVNLTAGLDITTTAQGVIDMRASGVGDGGFFSAAAGGNITLAGNILASGSSDDMDGGTGGDVLVDATGNVVMSGRVELNGAGQDASLTGFSVDGDSGSVDVSAGGTIQISGPMFGLAKGFGQGDEFSFDAGGNVTMAGEIDMTADNFGGDITVLSDTLITVSARLRTASPVDAQHPAALGGTVDVEGCQVNLTAPNGQLVGTGPGGSPSGANIVVASTGMTIAGTMIATDTNELDWRTSAPVITGSVMPPATLVQDVNLPCCGVQCPTTTTTTSTTSTTSTSSSTMTTHAPTTTTSAPIPTTTSSTAVIPTTTSSSAPIPTTTSSTAAPSTTTSSSKPSTTTTSSTAAPSTTTSSTAAASTTTSSTAAPSTTTSSTNVGSTTTTTSLPGASTTTSSTVASSSTTSSTTSPTSSTLGTTSSTSSTSTSSSSTVLPTSSTLVTTSTAPVPTTSTTQPPTGCLDTTTGIDAVRCRIELLLDTINTSNPQALGGNNLANALAHNLERASKFTIDPTTAKKLKKAATQLKKFNAKLNRAISKGKVDATIGNELATIATEARSELLGLSAS